jgi:hypothetical protein
MVKSVTIEHPSGVEGSLLRCPSEVEESSKTGLGGAFQAINVKNLTVDLPRDRCQASMLCIARGRVWRLP